MENVSISLFNRVPPYKASLTREQFLFYEMRVTAELMVQGVPDEEIVRRIVEDNLFQYPTEKSLERIAKGCLRRLKNMNDMFLIKSIAEESATVARQICLYALMKQNGIVWEFMLTVIGEKYRQHDLHFSRLDINVFFMRLQEQNDTITKWSQATITKLAQVS